MMTTKLNRDPDDGFAPRYRVHCLYEQPPALAAETLRDRLLPHLEGASVESLDERGQGSGKLGWRVSASGADHDIRWLVKWSAPSDHASELSLAVRQSWWWPEGKGLVGRCRAAVSLADDGAAELDHRERLQLFQRVLVSLVQAAPPLLIHWQASQQLVNPDELVETMLADDFSNPLPGALNVRYFRLEVDGVASEDQLMDTVGLAALGLPDLQCHFRGLDPADVSRVLYSTSCYLFDHGRVLRSGNTVQGPDPEDRWRCQLEDAIAEPRRAVFDLHPGFPFAAGEGEGEGE